ncbi:MAG: NAD-dependent epimerase/dehydratase family protein [Pseudomonadota bacterium]
MKRVAVTGATGFIGQRLCPFLQAAGFDVRILIRDATLTDTTPTNVASSWSVSLGTAESVIGSLDQPASLEELVRDVDAVVHAAGLVRGNSAAPFLQVNRDGTEALIQALSAVNPQAHCLLISSLAAREPTLSWYAQSKREAEARLAASTLRYTILRPPAVYGPGDKEMQAIFASMARGFAPVPGSRQARTALLHVDDLVRAISQCLGNENVLGQCFELHDGRANGYEWQDLADTAAHVYGRPVRLVNLPGWLLDTVATLNLVCGRLLRRPAMLTPPKLRELRHRDWTASNTAITAATGWTPAITLHAGLESLVQTAQ